MAQISNGISNPVVAGIVYWLIRILICGGCLVGAGILLAFTGIKIGGLYKKYCWDMITRLVTLISMGIAIYFGDWIKTVLPINLLFFLLFVQLVYEMCIRDSICTKLWDLMKFYLENKKSIRAMLMNIIYT